MNLNTIISDLKKARAGSKKRKFEQSVELMINFVGLDMKKPQNQINIKVSLPNPTGKGSGKVAVFCKSEAFQKALNGKVDKIILDEEIEAISKDKAKVAELLSFDALFAEGPCMLTVAKYMGQLLATKGKMPKIIPAVTSIEDVIGKAKTQITVSNRKGKFMPVVHTLIGKESMDNKLMAENVLAIYDGVMNSLPQKKQNIKNAYVKLTMGAPIKLGDEE
jgi:large subunit ribosomal protein L1